MNISFNMAYTKQEIENALEQMRPLKSRGLDGFGIAFLKQHWSTVGDTVFKAARTILKSVGMTFSLNSTCIALIP